MDANLAMSSHPVCLWDLVPSQQRFTWADGHWEICGTYHANIHVELLCPRPHRAVMSDVCLSHTSGLSQEQRGLED